MSQDAFEYYGHPDLLEPEASFELRLKAYRQFLFVSRRALKKMEAESHAWMLDAAAALERGDIPPDHPDLERLTAGEGPEEFGPAPSPEEAKALLEEFEHWPDYMRGSAEEAIFVEALTDEEQAVAREMRLLVSMKGCAMALTALEVLLRDFAAEVEAAEGVALTDRGKKGGERERLVDALIAQGMAQPFTKVQRRELDMIRTARNRYVHDLALLFREEDLAVWLEWMPTNEFDEERVGDIALKIVEICGSSLSKAFRARWS